MTNANDPISPTTGNEYISNSGQTTTVGMYGGLTKREHFAALSKPDLEGYTTAQVEYVLGIKRPENDHLAVIIWFSKFEAILKVIAADALIEALNKNK